MNFRIRISQELRKIFMKHLIVTITRRHEEINWECVSTGAAGAQTRRSLGHHLLYPLILRLLLLCAPSVLRPRALQDAPAPADPKF